MKKQALEQFYTSKVLADFLAKELIDVIEKPLSECSFLEPACGDGALIQALIDAGVHEHQIVAYDIDKTNIDIIRSKFPLVEAHSCDFLNLATTKEFDVCFMNPPWGKLELDRWAFFRQFATLPPSIIEKEKIVEELLTNKTIKKNYEEYIAMREQAMKNKSELKTYQELFLERVFMSCECIAVLCPDLFSRQTKTPKEMKFRELFYKSLRKVYRFHNEMQLFENVHHCLKYLLAVFAKKSKGEFILVDNLFHPVTVERSYKESRVAPYVGTKNSLGNWELNGHPERIITVNSSLLQKLAEFTGVKNFYNTPLPVIHGEAEKELFCLLASCEKLKSVEFAYSQGFNESNAPKAGLITRTPGSYPLEYSVLTGPNIFVGNPAAKEPNEGCKHNQDFSQVNLQTAPANFVPKAVYKLTESGINSNEIKKKTPWGTMHNGEFRIAIREFVGSTTGARTLSSAVIPKNISHVHTVVSLAFKNSEELLKTCSFFNSLIFDFLVRSFSSGHVNKSILEVLPTLSLTPKNSHLFMALFARTLRLAAISEHYSELWEWAMAEYSVGFRALELPNLYKEFMLHGGTPSHINAYTPCNYSSLPSTWSVKVPLRSFEEREQALCETDVLTAILFGINKDTLLKLYRVQFAVLQKNFQDFPLQQADSAKTHFPRFACLERCYNYISDFFR